MSRLVDAARDAWKRRALKRQVKAGRTLFTQAELEEMEQASDDEHEAATVEILRRWSKEERRAMLDKFPAEDAETVKNMMRRRHVEWE